MTRHRRPLPLRPAAHTPPTTRHEQQRDAEAERVFLLATRLATVLLNSPTPHDIRV